jgi:hypothetical protein
MVTRTYYESQDKPIYTVREEVGEASGAKATGERE